MIIDFHAHLGRDPVAKLYYVEELLKDMEDNGIDRRMVSALEGRSTSAQNDAVIELVKQHPGKLIGCAVVNPKEDDSVREAARVASCPEIRALEFNTWEHGYLPERLHYHLDPILDIAGHSGLAVKLFAGWGPRSMPQQWASYAAKHPKVTFVVLHIGGIDFGYGSIDLVRDTPNMLFETSGQTELQVLRKAFRVIPAEKFLFGSNYPEHFTKCSMDVFDVLELPPAHRQKIFCDNARRLLDL